MQFQSSECTSKRANNIYGILALSLAMEGCICWLHGPKEYRKNTFLKYKLWTKFRLMTNT